MEISRRQLILDLLLFWLQKSWRLYLLSPWGRWLNRIYRASVWLPVLLRSPVRKQLYGYGELLPWMLLPNLCMYWTEYLSHLMTWVTLPVCPKREEWDSLKRWIRRILRVSPFWKMRHLLHCMVRKVLMESCLSLLKKERKASFVSIWRRNTESQISLIHIVR